VTATLERLRSVRVLPALLAGLAVGITSCGSPRPARDLNVLSFAPTGDQATATPIEVRFDKPVIDEGEVGKPAASDVISLSPTVPWKGYWQDRQTLIIEPQAPLAGFAPGPVASASPSPIAR
jgi:hypothetical protein